MSGAATETTVPGLEALDVVVDSDFHLTERQEDFFGYLPSPFAELLSRDLDRETLGYLASLYPSAGFLTPAATGKARIEPVRTRADVRAGMELLSDDAAVVTPTQNLYLGCVHHDDLAVAMAHAYNGWVLEEIYAPDEGIVGPVTVAPQKPARAAEEIDDRAGEDAIVAVFLPSGGVYPLLGHEFYHPLYEAAQDHGLPVMLHNASGTQMMMFPEQFRWTNRYLSNHAHTHAMIHMSHLTDIVTRGIPVRFPDLTFVFQEAGLGWVPYMKHRLDNEYDEKREDAPMLERRPSEYIDDRCYFTSQPVEGATDPDYVTSIVRLLGVDNLMFSSDYPHPDFDHSSALFEALRGAFTDDEVAAVYGGTALDVFDLA